MAMRILFAIIFLILLGFAIIGMATCLIVFALRDDQERKKIRENKNQSTD